jgi:hypothetical protein
MITQQVLTNFAAWLEEAVCKKLQFKRAVKLAMVEDEGYEYTLITPAVYVSTFPLTSAEHESPEDTRPVVAPCVIVSSSGEGSLDFATGRTETPVKLMLQVWNPGQHVAITREDGHVEKAFEVDAAGYNDVASFVERILEELNQSELPGGLVVSSEARYALPDVEENSFYPYYRGTVEFSVTHYRKIKPKFDI